MTHGVDPENSAIIRFSMLFTGVMIFVAGIVAAVQLHWAALVILPFAGLILWGWWISGTPPSQTAQSAMPVEPVWPTDIPRLYPDLDGVALCEFLAPPQFEAIKRFPIVTILPFISKRATKQNAGFGRGLQFLLIRDLMLVPNISVHGPEDTPKVFAETARELVEGDDRSTFVTGNASFDDSGYRLELAVHAPGQKWVTTLIEEVDLPAFLANAAATIAKLVGGQVDSRVASLWRIARPASVDSLVRFGSITLTYDDAPEKESTELLQLAADDPSFGLPVANLDAEFPNVVTHLLEGLRRDPHDAQLCFGLFCRIWRGNGWDPAAMQFARRAIELSPGHGKAHMCAPHAAHPDAHMLPHSELGYRLLPGNTFAVNNYVINLEATGGRPEELVRLAKEGISNDPQDPGNYERLIELYCKAEDYRTALVVAESLQALFEPEINERTLYCLQQNPRIAERLARGQYFPAAENEKRIAQLRTM